MMRYWNYLRESLQSFRTVVGKVFHGTGQRHPSGPATPQEHPKPPHFLSAHEGQSQRSPGARAGLANVAFDEDEWRILL